MLPRQLTDAGRAPSADDAVLALDREELSPRDDLGMLLEQGAALTLGHPAPDAELHPVVEGVGTALRDDRTVTANDGSFALRRSAHEQLVGIGRSTQGLGHPGDPGFPVYPLKWTLNGC